ncbi:hypothetical protein Tco_1370997 [Tanacetum coccineum]
METIHPFCLLDTHIIQSNTPLETSTSQIDTLLLVIRQPPPSSRNLRWCIGCQACAGIVLAIGLCSSGVFGWVWSGELGGGGWERGVRDGAGGRVLWIGAIRKRVQGEYVGVYEGKGGRDCSWNIDRVDGRSSRERGHVEARAWECKCGCEVMNVWGRAGYEVIYSSYLKPHPQTSNAERCVCVFVCVLVAGPRRPGGSTGKKRGGEKEEEKRELERAEGRRGRENEEEERGIRRDQEEVSVGEYKGGGVRDVGKGKRRVRKRGYSRQGVERRGNCRGRERHLGNVKGRRLSGVGGSGQQYGRREVR